MKKIAVYILLICSLSANEYRPLPYAQLYPLLSSIDNAAIMMGRGDKDVYVFIDPLCKYSRKFMRLTNANEALLKEYRFHLFLYEIPRLHSAKVINAVYASQNQLQTLQEIMLHDKHIQSDHNDMKVPKISSVAKHIGVFKRPFVIVAQEE